MADSKQIQFVKGSAVLILSNLVIKGINFLLLPLYTKYLTPDALGVSDTISGLTSVLYPLLVMGMDSAFSAFYFDESGERYQASVFNTIWGTLFMTGMVPILMIFAAQYIASLLFGSDTYSHLVRIALVSVSLNLWYLPFSILLRLKNRMTAFSLVNMTASLSMILLNVLFLRVLHLGTATLIVSSALVQLIQLILYGTLSRTRIRHSLYDTALAKRIFRYSLPLVPNAVVGWILNMSNRYFILRFCGEASVGLYGISSRICTAVALVANGVYMAYTTYAYGKKNEADAKLQYARVLNALTYAMLCICFTVSLFGREVITIMADSSYYGTLPMLTPLVYSQLLYGICTIVGYAIGFEKKTKYTLMATSAGAAVSVILNIILLPRVGAVAASYTNFASFAVMMLLTYVFAQKLYPVDYRFRKILLSVVLTFALALAARNAGFWIKAVIWLAVAGTVTAVYKDTVSDYLQVAKKLLKRS